MNEIRQAAPWGGPSRSGEMRTPDEVAAMLRLKRLGWVCDGSRESSAAAI